MKWVVWALLLLNVALFGYFKWRAEQPGESHVAAAPIDPGKIRILTPQALEALPKKTATAVPASPQPVEAAAVHYACYEWAGFAAEDISRVRSIIDKFNLEAVVKQQAGQEEARYWVYIPPRKSLAEAQAKMGELKALGVDEGFIVQEPQWRNAISLGVFKEEASAGRLLEDLRARGVHTAVKGRRNHGSMASFYLKDVSSAVAEEIGKFRPDFPGSELKQAPCQ